VGADSYGVVEALEAVLAAAEGDALGSRVILLGDLFDAYLGAAQHGVGAFARLVQGLQRAALAGVQLAVLHGNRDFLLGAAFERATGAAVVAGGLRLRLGAREALLLHGDELCLRDVPYQRFKRVVRHPLTRGLARVLPGAVSRRVAARARGGSRRAAAQEPADTLRFEPTAEAVDAALERAELLVFGHIHRPARGRRPGGGEYCVLPAFDETSVHLIHDADGLRFAVAGGGAIADYAPRDFPPGPEFPADAPP